MNQLDIINPRGFVNVFLNSISKISEDCILNIEADKIKCLNSTPDGTLVQLSTFNNSNTFKQTLNVPDVKRLHKITSCITDAASLSLSVDTNSISYKSKDTRFKFYLLEDGILTSPALSAEKIEKLQYDTELEIPYDRLINLVKGSSFANETEKIYFYTDGNELYGELTDRERSNTDSFCTLLSDSVDCTIKPLAFNFENFRIITGTQCNSIKLKINTTLSVVRVDIERDNCYISYIISALVK